MVDFFFFFFFFFFLFIYINVASTEQIFDICYLYIYIYIYIYISTCISTTYIYIISIPTLEYNTQIDVPTLVQYAKRHGIKLLMDWILTEVNFFKCDRIWLTWYNFPDCLLLDPSVTMADFKHITGCSIYIQLGHNMHCDFKTSDFEFVNYMSNSNSSYYFSDFLSSIFLPFLDIIVVNFSARILSLFLSRIYLK